MTKLFVKPSEWLMVIAGLLILVSVFWIFAYQDFTVWLIAKLLYGAGVIFLVIEGRYGK